MWNVLAPLLGIIALLGIGVFVARCMGEGLDSEETDEWHAEGNEG